MKKVVILIFCLTLYINNDFAQCINADFSQGNFTGWTGSTGDNSSSNYINIVPGIVAGVPNSAPSSSGRQTIMNIPGTDHNTGGALSVLPPGGTSSARLGNEIVSSCAGGSAQAERLEYLLAVTSANCLFTYQYAIVLQDPSSSGHSPTQVPKFTIYVLNSSGVIVDPVCGEYEVEASSALPGFNTCVPDGGVCDNSVDVVWKDWTTVVIDLSPYIGQNITIQFTTYDCSLGAHFGYAYIACSCSNLQLTQMCSGTSAIVSAPVGFASYLWSPGGQTTSSITIPNPVAGDTVTCNCTSVTGCPVTLQLVLQPMSIPVFTLNSPTICQGNSATITATGTNTYAWSTGQSGQSITVTPAITTIYTVTATSSGGCSDTAQTTVTVDQLSATITEVDAHCGHPDGSASVLPSGTSTYTYLWNTVPPQYNQTAVNIPAGSYSVTVTDANGCTTSATTTVGDLPGPSVSITNIIDETCSLSNGSVTITVSGGTSGYTYQWDSNPPQYSQTLQNVSAGSYNITVTDANNCTATNSVTLTNTPPPVLSLINTTPANCGYSNGSVEISAVGGMPPYQYLWNTVPPQNTQIASGIPTGSYTVTATDNIGCNATITGTVTQLPGPIVTATGTPEICFHSDGTASVTASGGYGSSYTYDWDTNPQQTTQTAINLPSGTYTVTVDDGGCTATTSVNVTNTPGPTAYFIANPKVLTIDGIVSFQDNSSGNIASWQWTLGDGSTAGGIAFDHKYNSVGTFVVTLIVTDNNGCTDTISDIITVKNIFTIYIPNAFTPDDDTDNDYFFPQGVNWDPDYFQMNIFNRWGSLIYHTNTIGDKWNGTLNNSGTWDDVVIDVYVYVIRVKEMEGPKHEYIGSVTLIR